MLKLLISTIFVLNLFGNNTDNIKVYTENYPPYNMEINGKIKGISVEVLNEMYKQMGISEQFKQIKLVPWARGYNIVLKKTNTMLFSTVRNKVREDKFKWVGPIVAIENQIITLVNNNIVINKAQDLKKYKVGVILGWSSESELKNIGIDKEHLKVYVGKNASKKAFEDLVLNKIDMFVYSYAGLKYDKNLKTFNQKDFKPVYNLGSIDLYYSFNKNANDTIIQKWQKSLDKIKKNGQYQEILKKYK